MERKTRQSRYYQLPDYSQFLWSCKQISLLCKVSKFLLMPCILHNPGNHKAENPGWGGDQRCPDCQPFQLLQSLKDPASRFRRFPPAYAAPIRVSPSEKGEVFPDSPAALLNKAQTDVPGWANMSRSLSSTLNLPTTQWRHKLTFEAWRCNGRPTPCTSRLITE